MDTRWSVLCCTIVIVILGGNSALPTQDVSLDHCVVSDWSPWTEWVSSSHDNTIRSYPVIENAGPQHRLDKREVAMALKEQTAFDKLECLYDGSCPELESKPLEGFIPCTNGYAGEVPCWNIDQMSFLPKEMMDPEGLVMFASDIWGWTDPMNGDEYAIMGFLRGTAFVRVTDPQNPVAVGYMYFHSGSHQSFWRDMKVTHDHVYVVSEGEAHGIQIFDLTRLRGHPQGNVTVFEPDAHYDLVGNCHNLIVNEEVPDFMYAVGCTDNTTLGCGGGLHIMDVTDPVNPSYVACWGGDGYVHDAQCVIYHGPDTAHIGKEICLCFDVDVLTILDVTDKSNMQVLSTTSYQSAAYTHQGWLTEDHTVLLMDDEQDEKDTADPTTKTYIWDVVDLDAPVLMNTHRSTYESVDHNQYIVGNYVYQANYEAGLRVLDIDQTNFELTEIGYFDVFPNRTTANYFFGTWSIYPFFDSENIIISSIEFGLYTVRLDTAAVNDYLSQKPLPNSERTRYRDVIWADDMAACPPLQETERSYYRNTI